MTDNLVIETIKSRRTIHDYLPTPVPVESIHRALECAIRAPNHKLTNPWRFTHVAHSLRASITEIAVLVKNQKRPLTAAQEVAVRKKVSDPPELLVVSQRLDDSEFRRREDYAACACAIQNFSLALWSEGIGTKWSSGAVTYAPETYELLNIDSDREEIIGFLWIGYPEVVPNPPRDPLSTVLRSES